MEHKSRKLPKVVDHADVLKMLDCCNTKTRTGLRNYCMVVLMWREGLRVSEVANLMLDDVDLAKGSVYVQLGKGQVDRYVYLDSTSKEWLAKWIDKRPQSEYFVSCIKGKPGHQLDVRQIRQVVYNLSAKAGVYIRNGKDKIQVSPHKLRHTYATEMLEDGFNIEEVRVSMGHSNIATTSVYTHVRDAELAKKVAGRKV
jgi:site-specific recombinase XerD